MRPAMAGKSPTSPVRVWHDDHGEGICKVLVPGACRLDLL